MMSLSLRPLFLGSIAVLFVLLPVGAAALQPVSEQETSRLAQLYDQLLQRGGSDAYLDKRIMDERTRIRSLVDDSLNATVNRVLTGSGDLIDTQTALERQRAVVVSLEEQLTEATVDLDIVTEQEHQQIKLFQSGSGQTLLQLRKDESVLLAKQAVLEERVNALDFFLVTQRERLSQLSSQQRLEQFSTLLTIAKYLGILLVVFLFDRLLRMHVFVRIRNPVRRYAATKLVTAGIYLSVIVWLLAKFFAENSGFFTSFAIFGAVFVIGLQDIFKDLVGWLLILQRRSFTLGQRIAVGEFVGDVTDISLLRTTLLEVGAAEGGNIGRTGKTLAIPNSYFLTRPVLNYNATSDFVTAEFTVTVTYDADWRGAERILQEILEEEAGEYVERVRLQHATRTQHFYLSREPGGVYVYVDLGPTGVLFTLHFYVPIGKRKLLTSQISRKILERFAAADPPIRLAQDD